MQYLTLILGFIVEIAPYIIRYLKSNDVNKKHYEDIKDKEDQNGN